MEHTATEGMVAVEEAVTRLKQRMARLVTLVF